MHNNFGGMRKIGAVPRPGYAKTVTAQSHSVPPNRHVCAALENPTPRLRNETGRSKLLGHSDSLKQCRGLADRLLILGRWHGVGDDTGS